jgi:hypothetical protein
VIQSGLHLLADQTRAALSGPYNEHDAFSWGRPDPYYAAAPAAVAFVRVTRSIDPGKTLGAWVTISDSEHGIFKTKVLTIPQSLLPGQTMVIPVVMEPYLLPLSNPSWSETSNKATQWSLWMQYSFKHGHQLVNLTAETGAGAKSYAVLGGTSAGNFVTYDNPTPYCP